MSRGNLDRRHWVEPPADSSDDETWDAIVDRLDGPPERKKRVWPAMVLAAAAAAAIVALAWPTDQSTWAGTTLSSGEERAVATLEDGSEVVAEPSTVIVRESSAGDADADVHLRMERGSATFDVARNEARTFVVHAADVEVRVVGTRFRVTRAEPVEVRVERGAVDVRVGQNVDRVRAGETWTRPEPTPAVEEVVPAPVEVEPAAQPARGNGGAERIGALQLFESAQTARRSGDEEEAARLYERFMRTHRRHRNAPLAAFELGRLRMDALGDFAGAARAFERAARRPSLRQDAMARRTQALAAAGQRGACVRARNAYRRAYPEGRHLSVLDGVCD